ncbi:hypothetical protein SNEBB_007820 [Seison nebaliae]|nr:hypothetical protein SNEBB_007820 [Seison nebaliae]
MQIKFLYLLLYSSLTYIIYLKYTDYRPPRTINKSISVRPFNKNMLFIVSVGRSGSTTLRYLLNSLPNYFIDGENKNAMMHIRNIYYVLRFAHQNDDDKTDRKERSRYFRRMILDLLVGVDNTDNYNVLGFKEIRFKELYELEFLLKLFPKSRFIMNYRRNLTSYKYSGFMRYYIKVFPDYLESIKRKIWIYQQFQKKHPTITRTITKEGMNVDSINKILMDGRFLKHLPKNCRFTQIPQFNAQSSCISKEFLSTFNEKYHNCDY